jgi:hypothetical protein
MDDLSSMEGGEQACDFREAQPGVLPEAQRAILPLRTSLSLKSKEILSFLATAEKGEGCSREHAQGWLDYHHAKGGPSARLLPKDIRTCWKHVSKVAIF